MSLTEVQDVLERANVKGHLKVYIKDNNSKWVDFTDRFETAGKNLLHSIRAITNTMETKLGQFCASGQTITMSNADRFWDQPFPSLTTTDGNTASFSTSANGQATVIHDHQLKIAVEYLLPDGTSVEDPLGVFLIENSPVTDSASGLAEIKLVGLQKRFMEKDASSVKDGMSWYTNRPIAFLIKELIKTVYPSSSAGVPSTYTLPDKIEIRTADNERTLSSFGRPPEQISGGNWTYSDYTTRALCWAQTTGDSQKYLYMGCDEKLYKYDPTTDSYTYCGTVTASYYIKRLWYNSNDGKLWGCAWPDIAQPGAITANITDYESMIIFSWNGTSFSSTASFSAFSGEYSLRGNSGDGLTTSRHIGGSHTTSPSETDHGENIAIPFSQQAVPLKHYIRAYDVGGDNSTERTDLGWFRQKDQSLFGERISGGVIGGWYNWDSQKDAGYYEYHAGWTEPVANRLSLRFSMNQRGCVMFNKYHSVSGAIIYWTHSSGDFSLKYYDCTYGVHGSFSNVANFSVDSRYFQPTAGCSSRISDTIYFAGMCWYDKPSDTYSRSYLYSFDLSDTGAPTQLYDANDYASKTYTVLDMDIFGDGATLSLLVSLFDRANLGTPSAYILAEHSTTLDANFSVIQTSGHQYLMLTGDSVGDDGYDGYCVQEGTMKLLRINDGTSTVTIMDDGWPCVEGESNLASNLAFDSDTRGSSACIIYGVSAPSYPDDTQALTVIGKYYLWKFDTYYSGRIELADFSDKSAWDALGLFMQMSDYVMGFDPDGAFYVVPRTTTAGTADYTLRSDAQKQLIVDIKKDPGYDEVYNYAEAFPYMSQLEAPAAEIKIKTRPTEYYDDASGNSYSPKFCEFNISQKDNLRKSIKCVCVKSAGKRGRLSAHDIEGNINETQGSGARPSKNNETDDEWLRFKYLIYESVIETQLASQYTSGTDIVLSSVFGGDAEDNGVHVGDWFVIQDPDTGADIIKQITLVTTSTNTIQVDSALGDNFEPNDPCQIIKSFASAAGTRATWSDEGITYLAAAIALSTTTTATLTSVKDISVGAILLIDSEEMLVTAVNNSTNVVSFSASDGTLMRGQGGTTAAAHSDGSIVRAYFAPGAGSESADNKPYEIGGTNVFLAFKRGSETDEDRQWTERFEVGDIITVECPGMVLKKNDQSKQSCYDTDSKAKYGRRNYPAIDNRFLSHKMAKDICRRVVNDYKNPHWIVTVKTKLLSWIWFISSDDDLTLLDVIHDDLFRRSPGYTVQGYPRSITHDPKNGTSQFVLRGITAY